ncbi:MAG: hypothetical protein MJD61_07115 [Proteobacteria bacterium]|nr:hypothetical protein [Pseudomonadota bacterium]
MAHRSRARHEDGGRGRTVFAGFLRGYLQLSQRRPEALLVAFIALSALALNSARRLDIDPRLEALLPQDTPAQAALRELRRRVPGSAPLYLAIESSDAALNRRLALRLRDEVATWRESHQVIAGRDPTFFLDRRLLFLPEARLRELADAAQERMQWQQCEALPGCVNFDDQPELPSEQQLIGYY